MLSIFPCVFWPSVCLLWRHTCLFRSFPHFLIGLFVSLALSCMSCLYILEINPLSVVSFAIIFSRSEGCFFHLAYSFLCCAEAFNFNYIPFVYFCFYFQNSGGWIIEDPAVNSISSVQSLSCVRLFATP